MLSPTALQEQLQTHELSENEWAFATVVSQSLVKGGMDENELRKAIAYLRTIKHKDGAGEQFFSYLTTLAKQGDRIGHSRRTKGYYEGLAEVCERFLKPYQDDAPGLDRILSWAARLMRYYKNAGPIGEIVAPEFESKRQLEAAKARQANKAKVGDILDAEVKAINKGKITCEFLGGLRLSPKDPKRAKKLEIGDAVHVQVIATDGDGGIKKIKVVD